MNIRKAWKLVFSHSFSSTMTESRLKTLVRFASHFSNNMSIAFYTLPFPFVSYYFYYWFFIWLLKYLRSFYLLNQKYYRELIHTPGACCPKYRRTACIVDGTKYEVSLNLFFKYSWFISKKYFILIKVNAHDFCKNNSLGFF